MCHRRAFTLIEVMIATTVGGLVLAAAYGVWHAAAVSHRRLETLAASTQALRSAHASLEGDVARATGALRILGAELTFPSRSVAGQSGTVQWSMVDGRLERRWSVRGASTEVLQWPAGLALRFTKDPARVIELTWEPSPGRILPGALATLIDPVRP